MHLRIQWYSIAEELIQSLLISTLNKFQQTIFHLKPATKGTSPGAPWIVTTKDYALNIH